MTIEKPILFSLSGKRIWVAGHNGLVGSAICRRLAFENCDLLTINRNDLDLRNQADVSAWLEAVRPQVVVVAAAKVGGIIANIEEPADFIYDNLMIEANIIHASHKFGIEKLLFLGSSCAYPKGASQPIVEEALMTGSLEETNEFYALAKIAGIKLCQAYRRQHRMDFICATPTNLYGPGDNFDLRSSHVLSALIRKAHEAKLKQGAMVVWGSGHPRRDLLYVDDCADALVHMLKYYSDAQHLNVGSGSDISILDLARLVADVVGFKGGIELDQSKPDGMPRKLLDMSRMDALGWKPNISLRSGIERTYKEFIASKYAV